MVEKSKTGKAESFLVFISFFVSGLIILLLLGNELNVVNISIILAISSVGFTNWRKDIIAFRKNGKINEVPRKTLSINEKKVLMWALIMAFILVGCVAFFKINELYN